MNCPKCKSSMERVKIAGVEIDRCTACKGLWFDEFELEALKVVKGTEAVDSGDAEAGKTFNKVDRISCSKCNAPMIRMVDNEQPHIWYETCDVCGGCFLDAGEFKDLKQNDLMDIIKDYQAKRKGGRRTKTTRLSGEAVRNILKLK
ncbi:MAG: hypothetical protein C0404_09420 [Verrucomicrobia bacterium]|nr:hypothetical protein [Verrucomicrobiota bacterium]